MNTSSDAVKPIVQLPLFPPDATELTFRIGVADQGNHIQMQIEVWSATDGTLVGMESRHSVPISLLDSIFEEFTVKFRRALGELVWPFPEDR